jgi:hypothetical protein
MVHKKFTKNYLSEKILITLLLLGVDGERTKISLCCICFKAGVDTEVKHS